MIEPERLDDEVWVVRCGLPPFVNRPLFRFCDLHPDGVYGFSVQASKGLSVDRLASACRNKTVGYTTVGAIRRFGYDVVQTEGQFWHATVVVPQPWAEEAAELLASLFQSVRNPNPRGRT